MSRRPDRLAYASFFDLGGAAPEEALDRFPGAQRLLAALAEAGRLEVRAYWRRAAGAAEVRRGPVVHVFVAERSRLAPRLLARIRRDEPDVVHLNGVHAALPTLAARAALGPRPRLVVQHHGEPPGRGRRRWVQRAARRVVDAYAFTGADGQAAPFRAAGILRPDVEVHEVLEGSTDFEPAPRGLARAATGVEGDPAVLWVGRLIAGKDPLTALAGFEALLARRPGARLWMLYGDATLEPALRRALAARPALAAAVNLVGSIPHQAVAQWASACELFLSTSLREGSGYALVEVLACGATPVVSDLAPHRAIVGGLGVRFRPGDAAGCGAALAAAAAAPTPPSVVRAEFERRLSWEAAARQLLGAYGGGRSSHS